MRVLEKETVSNRVSGKGGANQKCSFKFTQDGEYPGSAV